MRGRGTHRRRGRCRAWPRSRAGRLRRSSAACARSPTPWRSRVLGRGVRENRRRGGEGREEGRGGGPPAHAERAAESAAGARAHDRDASPVRKASGRACWQCSPSTLPSTSTRRSTRRRPTDGLVNGSWTARSTSWTFRRRRVRPQRSSRRSRPGGRTRSIPRARSARAHSASWCAPARSRRRAAAGGAGAEAVAVKVRGIEWSNDDDVRSLAQEVAVLNLLTAALTVRGPRSTPARPAGARSWCCRCARPRCARR